MPETSMNKNDGRVFAEYHVRLSGQVADMEAIAESHSEQATANLGFELGVLTPNRRHHLASRLFVYRISHLNLHPAGMAQTVTSGSHPAIRRDKAFRLVPARLAAMPLFFVTVYPPFA
jgi:hypothetical protein